MSFKIPLMSQASNGGTELTTRALIQNLVAEGRQDLLDFFDFYPSRIDEFDSEKPSIYVVHDLPGDPCFEHFWRDKGRRFTSIVFVSDWQHQQFMKEYRLSGDNCSVISNGVYPFDPAVLDKWVVPVGTEENPVRLIYHTTPHRGLEILYPVYELLYTQMKAAGVHLHLDVYSSFALYGWAERDAAYQELFNKCSQHEGITYHGAKPNLEVREALAKSHVFAFPSIWPETFCIALTEAMTAGVISVHSNLGALPQTSGGFSVMYPHISDLNQHANRFYQTLFTTIDTMVNNREELALLPRLAAQRANLLYNWKNVVPQWVNLLDSAKHQLTVNQS